MNRKILQYLPLIIIMLVAVNMIGCGTQIPSGHRGVFYSRFGTGTEFGHIYPEGFAWHMPYNSIFVYKTQIQENKEQITVLSSDGATIRLDVSILYHPIVDKLDSLQVEIGPNYYEVAIAPTLRGQARSVAGRYTPEEIYSTKREELMHSIITELRGELLKRHVEVTNVIIRDVQIPQKISEAINFKLTAAQEAEKMDFTIAKERKEAERKRIEAQGIADFQKIVSAGITNSLLKWKGIEATLKIAESPNTKVVIIGNESGSLPIILGGDGK